MDQKHPNGDQAPTFYGVHIPLDVQIQDTDVYWKVYQDKSDVLKLIKKYKKSRFKGFPTYEEAAEFAAHGSEYPNNNVSVDGATKEAVGEKPSQFRGPTSQSLVKLRKGIECGDFGFVQKTIWDNPRYLIGSGDTPSILQEGFRYNALHVAAKSKNPEMCELILNTISDVSFIRKLYVDDRNPEERAKILLDLYLNTPDKGLNETPLHFAVKFGAVKCVEVLVSFPQCDKNLRNKHDKMPKQIICDRYDGPDSAKLSEQMAALLQDNYYVPVLRSEDNCAPPLIGFPFSPTSPPNFNSDPLSPRLEIRAYAGPMHKSDADRFRKLWKTPPRAHLAPRRCPLNHSADSILRDPHTDSIRTLKPRDHQKDIHTLKFLDHEKDSIHTLKFRDHEKGLERIGHDIARKLEVAWKEYWPFLDSFVDIASEEGLRLLEEYLRERAKGLSISEGGSPELSGVETPPDVGEVSPMTELCKALQTCSLRERSRNGLDFSREEVLSPFFCVEKSLQVFAKRISNDILYLVEVQYDTCTVLEHQIKQLHLLMLSYMEDRRFKTVDFALVHSRLSRLITAILKDKSADLDLLEKSLDLWLEFFGKNYDCFSSDDEGSQGTVVQSKNQHSLCVLKAVQEFLGVDLGRGEVLGEEDCARVWGEGTPCGCAWRKSARGAKKGFGGKRVGSFRGAGRLLLHRQEISRKLSYNEDEDVGGGRENHVISNGESPEAVSSDEEFFTPPASPSLMEAESDEDDNEFEETQLPDVEVFIEGDFPTKVDAAVYKALNYADCRLTPQEYPNVYKWRHAVGLYNEEERQTWTSPSVARCRLPSPQRTSTPLKPPPPRAEAPPLSPTYTPSKSWLRITGANSPRASLKLQKGNISLNL